MRPGRGAPLQVDIDGPAGRLEALLEDPAAGDEPPPYPVRPERSAAEGGAESKGATGVTFAAVICHPHPQLGGTMHTHAVYRIAKAVRARGGTALRFNFRGVGRSAGAWDEGRGEVDDARAALEWLAAVRPGVPLLSCGFSFGAYAAVLAGGRDPRVAGLLLAGLAVHAAGLEELRDAAKVREVAKPVAVVQAANDALGPPDEVRAALAGSVGPRRIAVVPGATHLFTEDLPALQREAEAGLDWLLREQGGAR